MQRGPPRRHLVFRGAAICRLTEWRRSGETGRIRRARGSRARTVAVALGRDLLTKARYRSRPGRDLAERLDSLPQERRTPSEPLGESARAAVPVTAETRGAWVARRPSAVRTGESSRRCPRETIYFLGLHAEKARKRRREGFLDTSSRRGTGFGRVGASALCMDNAARTRLLAAEGECASAGSARRYRPAWKTRPREALGRATAV